MSIPKTTKFTLKRIVEGIQAGSIPNNGFGEEVKRLTPEQKARLHQMTAEFEKLGECLNNEDAIVSSAKGLTELAELAELYALNECGDVFQKNLVEKDMRELKKRVLEYTKIAKESHARIQQMGVSYQDIKHILGRYYNLKPAKSLDQRYTPSNGGDSSLKVDEGGPVCQSCGRLAESGNICNECK